MLILTAQLGFSQASVCIDYELNATNAQLLGQQSLAALNFEKAGLCNAQNLQLTQCTSNYKKAADIYVQLKKSREAAADYDGAAICAQQNSKNTDCATLSISAAELYNQLLDSGKAAAAYLRAAVCYEKTTMKTPTLDNYIKAAEAFKNNNDYEQADKQYEKAIALVETQRTRTAQQCSLYAERGAIYEDAGLTTGAAAFHSQAAECYSEIKERNLCEQAATKAAQLTADFSDIQSTQYYELAGKCFENPGTDFSLIQKCDYYNNLAATKYKNLETLDKAAEAYKNVALCHARDQVKTLVSDNYYLCAGAYLQAALEVENILNALDTYDEAIACFIANKDTEKAELVRQYVREMQSTGSSGIDIVDLANNPGKSLRPKPAANATEQEPEATEPTGPESTSRSPIFLVLILILGIVIILGFFYYQRIKKMKEQEDTEQPMRF